MRDYKNIVICSQESQFKHEAIKTGASFVLLILLLSLMGWSALDWPVPVKTPTLVDKESLRLYTAESLARHTAEINARMELQAMK